MGVGQAQNVGLSDCMLQHNPQTPVQHSSLIHPSSPIIAVDHVSSPAGPSLIDHAYLPQQLLSSTAVTSTNWNDIESTLDLGRSTAATHSFSHGADCSHQTVTTDRQVPAQQQQIAEQSQRPVPCHQEQPPDQLQSLLAEQQRPGSHYSRNPQQQSVQVGGECRQERVLEHQEEEQQHFQGYGTMRSVEIKQELQHINEQQQQLGVGEQAAYSQQHALTDQQVEVCRQGSLQNTLPQQHETEHKPMIFHMHQQLTEQHAPLQQADSSLQVTSQPQQVTVDQQHVLFHQESVHAQQQVSMHSHQIIQPTATRQEHVASQSLPQHQLMGLSTHCGTRSTQHVLFSEQPIQQFAQVKFEPHAPNSQQAACLQRQAMGAPPHNAEQAARPQHTVEQGPQPVPALLQASGQHDNATHHQFLAQTQQQVVGRGQHVMYRQQVAPSQQPATEFQQVMHYQQPYQVQSPSTQSQSLVRNLVQACQPQPPEQVQQQQSRCGQHLQPAQRQLHLADQEQQEVVRHQQTAFAQQLVVRQQLADPEQRDTQERRLVAQRKHLGHHQQAIHQPEVTAGQQELLLQRAGERRYVVKQQEQVNNQLLLTSRQHVEPHRDTNRQVRVVRYRIINRQMNLAQSNARQPHLQQPQRAAGGSLPWSGAKEQTLSDPGRSTGDCLASAKLPSPTAPQELPPFSAMASVNNSHQPETRETPDDKVRATENESPTIISIEEALAQLADENVAVWPEELPAVAPVPVSCAVGTPTGAKSKRASHTAQVAQVARSSTAPVLESSSEEQWNGELQQTDIASTHRMNFDEAASTLLSQSPENALRAPNLAAASPLAKPLLPVNDEAALHDELRQLPRDALSGADFPGCEWMVTAPATASNGKIAPMTFFRTEIVFPEQVFVVLRNKLHSSAEPLNVNAERSAAIALRCLKLPDGLCRPSLTEVIQRFSAFTQASGLPPFFDFTQPHSVDTPRDARSRRVLALCSAYRLRFPALFFGVTTGLEDERDIHDFVHAVAFSGVFNSWNLEQFNTIKKYKKLVPIAPLAHQAIVSQVESFLVMTAYLRVANVPSGRPAQTLRHVVLAPWGPDEVNDALTRLSSVIQASSDALVAFNESRKLNIRTQNVTYCILFAGVRLLDAASRGERLTPEQVFNIPARLNLADGPKQLRKLLTTVYEIYVEQGITTEHGDRYAALRAARDRLQLDDATFFGVMHARRPVSLIRPRGSFDVSLEHVRRVVFGDTEKAKTSRKGFTGNASTTNSTSVVSALTADSNSRGTESSSDDNKRLHVNFIAGRLVPEADVAADATIADSSCLESNLGIKIEDLDEGATVTSCSPISLAQNA